MEDAAPPNDERSQLRSRIAGLQREVFSREGEASPLVDTVDPATGRPMRLRANELELRDAQSRLNALDEAESRGSTLPGPTRAGPTLTEPLGSVEPETAPSEPTTDFMPPDRHASTRASSAGKNRRLRSTLTRPIAAALALLIGGYLIGTLAATRSVDTASIRSLATPSASPPYSTSQSASESASESASASASARPSHSAWDAFSIFTTTQAPNDIPSVPLGFDIIPSTVRALADDGETQLAAHAYVARTTSNLVCLAVVLPNNTSGGTCESRSVFLDDGLRLRLTSTDIVAADGAEIPAAPAYFQYFWAQDGSLTFGSNTFRFPSFSHP